MLSRAKLTDTPTFDKPIRSHSLGYASAHIVRGVDVKRFREVLRKAREGELLRAGKLGRPALSKLTAATGTTPVNAQTIKNIEDGINVDPGIATVSRIVEAMGLSLSEFFLQIERQTDGDSTTRANVSTTGRASETSGQGRSAVSTQEE